MSQLLNAATIVASLCLPPSPAQEGLYYRVVSAEVLQSPRQLVFAGFVTGTLPAITRVTLHYWRGPLQSTRTLVVEGYFKDKKDMEAAILSRVRLRDCAKVAG